MVSSPHDHSDLPDNQRRVLALETILTAKGYLEPAALAEIIDPYENKIDPRNGAAVVPKAWVEPQFKAWLLADGTAAIAWLDFGGRQREHTIVVENAPSVHILIVCTLCSCYPWLELGLPPAWYQSTAYRSRAVIVPRKVLAAFGTVPAEDVQVSVGLQFRNEMSGACHTAGRN
jgi:nitrile hydratase